MHVSFLKERKSSGYFDCVQFDKKKVTHFLPKIHYIPPAWKMGGVFQNLAETHAAYETYFL